MKLKNPHLLVIAIVMCQLAGIFGSVAVVDSISTWYPTLIKPAFNPPNWVFGPVWTTLYTLMGISLYLVWRNGTKVKHILFAVRVFVIHLVINSLWSIIFFGMKDLTLSLITIVILWGFIIYLIFKFLKINKLAGYLLVPYLVWVSFAAALNFSIWYLNR